MTIWEKYDIFRVVLTLVKIDLFIVYNDGDVLGDGHMKYRIADVTIETDCPLYMDGMKQYEIDDCLSDVKIRCDIKREINAVKLTEFYGLKNGIEEYGACERGYISQDRADNISYATAVYSDGFKDVLCELVDVEKLGGNPILSRMEVALGSVFLNCLPAFGGITFHASCIEYNGEALLFSAPSETGKSTHTGLWKKYYGDNVRYINDDTPVLKEKDGGFFAFGTPWAGTSGINNNISAPVKAIVYIARGSANSIRRLDVKESVIKAMQAARPQFFPIQRERQARIIFSLAKKVPAYELICDISRGAVEAVKNSLF